MAVFHPPGPPEKASKSRFWGSFLGGRFWKGFFALKTAFFVVFSCFSRSSKNEKHLGEECFLLHFLRPVQAGHGGAKGFEKVVQKCSKII